MSESNYQVARQIRGRLQTAGIRFAHEPLRGAVRPDFLLARKDGRALVIEAKGWSADANNYERAIHEAEYLKKAANADDAWIVLLAGPTDPVRGLVQLGDLERAIREWVGESDLVNPLTSENSVGLVFAAMPFAVQFDDTFWSAMVPACRDLKAECERVDHQIYEGEIPNKIRQMIDRCRAVIADLSTTRPNVFYEMGYAEGVGKPVIAICATPFEEIPFDVRNRNVLAYEFGRTYRLVEPLRERLRALIA